MESDDFSTGEESEDKKSFETHNNLDFKINGQDNQDNSVFTNNWQDNVKVYDSDGISSHQDDDSWYTDEEESSDQDKAHYKLGFNNNRQDEQSKLGFNINRQKKFEYCEEDEFSSYEDENSSYTEENTSSQDEISEKSIYCAESKNKYYEGEKKQQAGKKQAGSFAGWKKTAD